MKEIQLPNNTRCKLFINDYPNLDQIPPHELSLFVSRIYDLLYAHINNEKEGNNFTTTDNMQK